MPIHLLDCMQNTRHDGGVSALEIVEVGPRDGLQNEDAVLDVAARVAYIEALAAAGLRRIEAVSFVHPARVPQMADAEAVMAAVPRRDGLRYSGLVLNRRGLERAVTAGVDEINMVVVATDTFSAKNQGMTTAEAVRATAGIAAAARDAGLRVTLTVGAAFGCPFEGEVRPERVTDIVRQCAEAGVNEVALADTIGVAVPRDVRTLASAVRSVTDAPLRCHFHNTRNTGYANALAAIEAGVTVLDASSGGIGGCPFAPAATGNIATEDLLYALGRSGIGTGIDMAALLAASAYVEQRLGHANPALLGRAGMFPALRSSLVSGGGAAERQCGPGLRHAAAGDPGRHVRPGRAARRGGPSRLIGGEPDPGPRGAAPARVRRPARDPAQQGRPGPHLDRR
jgi:hydroxymethylglutaryl-CoA lyase